MKAEFHLHYRYILNNTDNIKEYIATLQKAQPVLLRGSVHSQTFTSCVSLHSPAGISIGGLIVAANGMWHAESGVQLWKDNVAVQDNTYVLHTVGHHVPRVCTQYVAEH